MPNRLFLSMALVLVISCAVDPSPEGLEQPEILDVTATVLKDGRVSFSCTVNDTRAITECGFVFSEGELQETTLKGEMPDNRHFRALSEVLTASGRYNYSAFAGNGRKQIRRYGGEFAIIPVHGPSGPVPSSPGMAAPVKCLLLAETGVIPDFTAGIRAGLLFGRFGFYLAGRSNFKADAFEYECFSDGTTPDGGYIWTSGQKRVSRLNLSAGGLFRISDRAILYAGAGYRSGLGQGVGHQQVCSCHRRRSCHQSFPKRPRPEHRHILPFPGADRRPWLAFLMIL